MALAAGVSWAALATAPVDDCQHPVYCNATVLERLAPLHEDSKFAVDGAMRMTLDVFQYDFDETAAQVQSSGGESTDAGRALWLAFHVRNFHEPGVELLRDVRVPDWNGSLVVLPRLGMGRGGDGRAPRPIALFAGQVVPTDAIWIFK